jgi:hypothetical protein
MKPTSMMEAFFERDLSEAEDEQLAQEIGSSLDASQRFADRMAQAWQEAGLAAPRPPRRLARAWLWGGAMAVLGLGLLAYSYQDRGEEPASILPVNGQAYRMETPQASAPGVRPSNAALALLKVSAEAGQRFVIQVELPQPDSAQLKVEDSQGRVLAWLNQGHLAAGRHDFSWPDPGKSGRYCIVLQTGQGHSQRWVRVGDLP